MKTINIIDMGNNSSKTTVPVRRKRKLITKTRVKMFVLLLILSLIFFFIAFASGPSLPKIGNEMCETDKCFARIERLRMCQKEELGNVVECATNKTLNEAREGIKEEIKSLYYYSLTGLNANSINIKKKHWKTKTVELLTSHEAFSPTPYCDKLVPFTRQNGTSGLKKACYTKADRYSIGYGTISYKGAPSITEEEATRRMMDELNTNFFPYVETLECWNDNEKAAIADFMYNSGKDVKHAITGKPFRFYVNTCNRQEILGFLNWKLYAGGVAKRKRAELNLFLSQN